MNPSGKFRRSPRPARFGALRPRSRATLFAAGLWLLSCLVLAGDPACGITQQGQTSPVSIVQQERNIWAEAAWAIAPDGRSLVSSNQKGTWLHLWKGGRFETEPMALSPVRADLLDFGEEVDNLVFARKIPPPELAKNGSASVAVPSIPVPWGPRGPRNDMEAMMGLVLLHHELMKFHAEQNVQRWSQTIDQQVKSGQFDINIFSRGGRRQFAQIAAIVPPRLLQAMVLSPDSSTAAVFDGYTSELQIINLRTGFNQASRTIRDQLYPCPLLDLRLSKTGKHLLVLQQGRLSLFDTETAEPMEVMETGEHWYGARLGFGGRYLVARDESGRSPKAIVQQISTGKKIEIDVEAGSQVHLTPDGKWLVNIDREGVQFIPLTTPTIRHRLVLHPDSGKTCQVEFAARSGRMFVWSEEPNRLYVIDYPYTPPGK